MKQVIYFVLLLCMVQTGNAQPQGGWRFGFRGGPNLAKMERTDDTNREEVSYLSGISAAFIFIQAVKEGRDLGIEVQYNMAGSDFGRPFRAMFYDGDYTTYRLHYLTIPIYYRFKSRIATLIEDFDLIFGASWSYLLAARQRVVKKTDHPFDSGPTNIRSQLNHFDYGFLTGISFPIWCRRMGLSLRYYHGLTQVVPKSAKQYPDGVQDRSSMQNRWILIGFEAYLN